LSYKNTLTLLAFGFALCLYYSGTKDSMVLTGALIGRFHDCRKLNQMNATLLFF